MIYIYILIYFVIIILLEILFTIYIDKKNNKKLNELKQIQKINKMMEDYITEK